MQVKYTGSNTVLLMHEGNVWEVDPGDEVTVATVPDLPNFVEVKPVAPVKPKGD